MPKKPSALLGSCAVWLLALAPAIAAEDTDEAEVECKMTFNLKGWSAFYKTAKGTGHVTCDNGQAADVTISAKGGGLTAGKTTIDDGQGKFSDVKDISEVFGSYASGEAHAGAVESAEAQALTKGEVSLALSGTGRGWSLGVAFGKFTIKKAGGVIAPGTNLLHFRVLEKLGEGGMGVVWKALDASLQREVALKVLPEAFAADPERLGRFEREAKLLASLSHPGIAAVYGLHEAAAPGGAPARFIVMELVRGADLASVLRDGPLPVDEALDLASQVAAAFAAAHDHGVIHRDLKPGNVVRTPDGRVKILDFGLAKAFAADAASGSRSLALSPTVTSAGTIAGMLLGTAAYMSPEQARGKPVDRRADVWAFGCLLYEMLTGKQAFAGETITDVLAAIVHREPDWRQLPATTPAVVRQLLERCLRKDLDARLRDMGDVRVLLEDGRAALSAGATGLSSAPELGGAKRAWLWPTVAGALAVALLAVLIGIGASGRRPASSAAAPQRFVLTAADLHAASTPLFSPDGAAVVFAVRTAGSRRIERRELGSFQAAPVPGTEEGQAPFFSPDGAWMGFVTPDAIKRVPTGGGVAQVVASVSRASAGEWGQDGMIYFTYRAGGPDGLTALARVPATGGTPEVRGKLDVEDGESEAWLPEILPDGKTVLVSVVGGVNSRILAIEADGTRRTVVDQAFLGRYVEPGFLLYRDMDSEAVVVAPFDPATARVTGAAVALTEQVDNSYCFDVSRDGKLVYVPTPGADTGDEVVWLDRSGVATPATDVRAQWMQPRISPDGGHVLLRKAETDCELWQLDTARGTLARIVDGQDAHDAIWGPDGRRVAYHQMNTGGMVTQTVGGMRETKTLAKGLEAGVPGSWSSSGLIAYTRTGQGTRDDIWIRAADGSGPAAPFAAGEFSESAPLFSRDGRWIAYVSDETGSSEVFVRSYPDSGGAWQVSTGGGRSPVWSADDRELFYRSGDKIMAVAVDTRGGFAAGASTVLFVADFGDGRTREFDVGPDDRFIAVRPPGGRAGLHELRLLIGWEQELRRTAGSASSEHP